MEKTVIKRVADHMQEDVVFKEEMAKRGIDMTDFVTGADKALQVILNENLTPDQYDTIVSYIYGDSEWEDVEEMLE